MKRVIFYLAAFFIIAPVLKNFTDILTDNTTGILYLAADNMTVNGVANPAGDYLLLLWQFFPWFVGAFVIFELFRWIGGRKPPKGQEPQEPRPPIFFSR
jgi:hypothetical protein